jgi:hypothetical protein
MKVKDAGRARELAQEILVDETYRHSIEVHGDDGLLFTVHRDGALSSHPGPEISLI